MVGHGVVKSWLNSVDWRRGEEKARQSWGGGRQSRLTDPGWERVDRGACGLRVDCCRGLTGNRGGGQRRARGRRQRAGEPSAMHLNMGRQVDSWSLRSTWSQGVDNMLIRHDNTRLLMHVKT